MILGGVDRFIIRFFLIIRKRLSMWATLTIIQD